MDADGRRTDRAPTGTLGRVKSQEMAFGGRSMPRTALVDWQFMSLLASAGLTGPWMLRRTNSHAGLCPDQEVTVKQDRARPSRGALTVARSSPH